MKSSAPTPTTIDTQQTPQKRLRRSRRKRSFSQISQDIDLNIHTPTNKKAKLSKTINFNLNDKKIVSRIASLPSNSPLFAKNKKRRMHRIEDYEVSLSSRSTRRNPLICKYRFFDGYTIGIV